MERNQLVYQTYVQILQRELICAMGCTEPIALAYCAAVARSTLGAQPDRICVEASGNIIKNVKSVVVPNTGGRRGIAAAACIGVLGGDENAGLEVISEVSEFYRRRLGPPAGESVGSEVPRFRENGFDRDHPGAGGDRCAEPGHGGFYPADGRGGKYASHRLDPAAACFHEV